MKKNKKYEVTQSRLYKCHNKRTLEKILFLDKYTLDNIDKLIDYSSFEISKKNTTEKRVISYSKGELKRIQSRILKLLQPIIRPNWLFSGEKNKSYIMNGKVHCNSDYLLTIDIENFYNNCNREYVFRFFLDYLKTSKDVAGILTDIVTVDSKIPTGCPTSQIIAYYAYMNMFEEINNISKNYGCVFTLYVDDMTFSSKQEFNHKKLRNDIDVILRKYGHKPKYKKIKYYRKNDMKPVTGTIITPQNTLAVPNSLQKKIYDDKNLCNQLKHDETILRSIRGRIQAANAIESGKFKGLAREIDNSIKKF